MIREIGAITPTDLGTVPPGARVMLKGREWATFIYGGETSLPIVAFGSIAYTHPGLIVVHEVGGMGYSTGWCTPVRDYCPFTGVPLEVIEKGKRYEVYVERDAGWLVPELAPVPTPAPLPFVVEPPPWPVEEPSPPVIEPLPPVIEPPLVVEEAPFPAWIGVLSLAAGVGLVGMIVYQASRRS